MTVYCGRVNCEKFLTLYFFQRGSESKPNVMRVYSQSGLLRLYVNKLMPVPTPAADCPNRSVDENRKTSVVAVS